MGRYGLCLLILALGCPENSDAPVADGGPPSINECAASERQCKDEETAQVCSFGRFIDLPCGANQFCQDGECLEPVCVAGAVRCNEEGRRERCEDRGRWFEAAPCDNNQRCVNVGECEDPVCQAGESRCNDEGAREVCNEQSSGWVTQACDRDEVCSEGNCRRTLCSAGRVSCIDDTRFGTCSEDELGFTEITECPSGESCSGGVCVPACDLARERSSYDGCTFFAVDLPNYSDSQRVQANHPYAVVLANPNLYEVQVTVTERGENDEDRVVELVASQQVRNIGGRGGAPSQTVYSESRSAGGRQLRLRGEARNLVLPAGGQLTMILPPKSAGTILDGAQATYTSELADRAYKVMTTAPVTAYQFQPLCCSWTFTNDATILLPVGSQGRHYYTFSHTHVDWTFQGQSERLEGWISIVGGERTAEVELRMGERVFQTIPEAREEGNSLFVTVEPYDVLTIMSVADPDPLRADLTGVEVVASEEVGVFGGHLCAYVPEGYLACDHLETVNLPVETWRNRYVGAHTVWRSNTRAEANYYRLMASEASEITFDPPLRGIASLGPIKGGLYGCLDLAEGDTLILGPGEWCEFGTKQDFQATGTGKFAMTQFISSGCTTGDANCGVLSYPPPNSGDPSMMAIPPTAQYRSEYTFLTPETYAVQYVTIIHSGGAILELDGVGVNAAEMGDRGRTPYLSEDATRIGNSPWYRSTVLLGAGQHNILDLTGQPFGILVYAYSNDVSYAYPGGMDLTKE